MVSYFIVIVENISFSVREHKVRIEIYLEINNYVQFLLVLELISIFFEYTLSFANLSSFPAQFMYYQDFAPFLNQHT